MWGKSQSEGGTHISKILITKYKVKESNIGIIAILYKIKNNTKDF